METIVINPQTQAADERAELYLDLMSRGLTYSEVARETNAASGDAVRLSIRRYNDRKYGVASGYDPELNKMDEETPQPGTRNPTFKILTFDIETAPGTALYFSPKTRYIPMDNMIEDGRILCFAAKWMDGPMIFSSEWDHGREGMLQTLFTLLDQADAVVSYNGDNFDIPWANTEFQKMGLGRYRPFKSIDLIKPVKKHFRFMYNKLDFLSQQLLGERKIENGGISMWKELMFGSNPVEARELFKLYNKKDVELTEQLYYELRPWLDQHPAVVYTDKYVNCRVCGSSDVSQVGWKTAIMMRYPLYQCHECGSFGRTTHGGERISTVFNV